MNSVQVMVLSTWGQKLAQNRFVWYGSRKLQLPLLRVGCLDTPAAAQILLQRSLGSLLQQRREFQSWTFTTRETSYSPAIGSLDCLSNKFAYRGAAEEEP